MNTDNCKAGEGLGANPLIPNHLTAELDVPTDPEWLSNSTPHTLLEIDPGQLEISVNKSPGGVIHVYVKDVMRERFANAETPIDSNMRRPLQLYLAWETKGLRLRLGDGPPAPLPWQALPQLPHR